MSSYSQVRAGDPGEPPPDRGARHADAEALHHHAGARGQPGGQHGGLEDHHPGARGRGHAPAGDWPRVRPQRRDQGPAFKVSRNLIVILIYETNSPDKIQSRYLMIRSQACYPLGPKNLNF